MPALRRFLRTLLLLPVLYGLSGIVSQADAIHASPLHAALAQHAGCPDPSCEAHTDAGCDAGTCQSWSLLPTAPVTLRPGKRGEGPPRPAAAPPWSGRSITPAQEPPRRA